VTLRDDVNGVAECTDASGEVPALRCLRRWPHGPADGATRVKRARRVDVRDPPSPRAAFTARNSRDPPRAFGLCHDCLVDETFFIDIWSDVVCPFCYLGTRQLEMAVERFAHGDVAVIRRHAFELDPHAPTISTLPLAEGLAKKYDLSLDQARSLNQRLENEAMELGMRWRLDIARPTSTFDAHRLIALAATQDLGRAMSDRLFRAYFSEGAVLADRATLDELAGETGVEGVTSLWDGDEFTRDVRNDERAAEDLGISGVPSVLLDDTFMVVGAQGAPHFLEALDRAWLRRKD